MPNRIRFAAYAAGELAEIFRRMSRGDDYRLEPEADAALTRVCEALAARADEPDFGNARTVRNLYEEALMRHAERVADAPGADLSALTAGDIEQAAAALPVD